MELSQNLSKGKLASTRLWHKATGKPTDLPVALESILVALCYKWVAANFPIHKRYSTLQVSIKLLCRILPTGKIMQ